MLAWLTHWMTGWARWEVRGRGGERFLNACARKGLSLWGLRAEKGGISGCVRARQYRLLLGPARQARVRPRVRQRGGLPFRLLPLRRRPGILTGAAVFLLLLGLLSQCFWTVEVKGCAHISESALRAALAQQGVAPGARKAGFSGPRVQAALMARFPQISWITVNNSGSDIEVQLTEKQDAPKVANQKGWYHLRAAESGQVLELRLRAGTPLVQKGDGVVKGQLLVSAVLEDAEGAMVGMCHAAGQVFAHTAHSLSVQIALQYRQWEPSGQAVRRSAISLFGARLPLSLQPAPSGPARRGGTLYGLRLGGRELPLYRVEEELTPMREVRRTRSPAQALQLAQKELIALEKQRFPRAQVLSRKDSVQKKKDCVVVQRQLACKEDIAVEVEIGEA